MVAGLLNKGIRGSLALLIALFAAGFLLVYFAPRAVETTFYPDLFYNYFSSRITAKFAICGLNFLFAAAGAVMVSLIVSNHELVDKQNYFPVFLYLLLCIACASPVQLTPQLLTNGFVIFAIYRLLGTYRSERALNDIYEAAFLLSCSAYITISSVISFPLFFVMLLILRSFHWREWVVAIIGFLMPVFIYECMAYLTDFNQWYLFDAIGLFLRSLRLPSFSEYYLPLAVSLFVLLVIAIGGNVVKGFGNTVKRQRSRAILLWYLFFSLFGFFFRGASSTGIIMIFALPVSFFVGDLLYGMRQLKIANTLLVILLLCTALVLLGEYNVV